MDKQLYASYLDILKQELVPALGCTEPIAIALAGAKARELLDATPEKAEVCCSGNIIKNVKGVLVPNSGGRKGVPIAAALGIFVGDASKGLEVLVDVDDTIRQKAADWVEQGFLTYTVDPDVDNLYIDITLHGEGHSSRAVIEQYHTQFVLLEKDGEILLDRRGGESGEVVEDENNPKALLSVDRILEFARCAKMEDVEELLDQQIALNSAISDYGLTESCGCQIGKTLLSANDQDIKIRAKARAAAGSDARMSGCTMPVVINSGSGNQGLTVSLPVIEYARELGADKETLCRALLISNLVAIHQKYYIGNLSAFCGAVSAAAGAGAGITYLHGGSDEAIASTITNTLANTSGIICDGAKASCAAKIATAVDAAILADAMSQQGIVFPDGDGIVHADVEKTMKSVGHVGKQGMQSTDREVLRLMTDQVEL